MRTTSGIFERRWPTLHQERSQPGMSLRCSKQRLHQGRLVNSFNEIQVEMSLQLGSMPSTEQFVFNHACIVYTLNRNVNSKSANWDFEYHGCNFSNLKSEFFPRWSHMSVWKPDLKYLGRYLFKFLACCTSISLLCWRFACLLDKTFP